MHWQLARVPGANAANQPQRPADEALCLARAIKAVVGDEQLRVSGRLELRLQPAGVEQQSVDLLAFPRLGEVMGEVEVAVSPRPPICSPARNAVEGLCDLLMEHSEALLARAIVQKVTHRVVQPEKALSEIEVEQEREIEQPTQQVFSFEVFERASRGPQARGHADGYLRVLGENAEFAKARSFAL